jgi:YbbR domain-containing protein
MMERLLRNNTIVKIFAFFLALMLWMYVTGVAQRENTPPLTRTFRNVPLAWINLDEGLEIMEIPAEVNVVLNGRSDLINGLTPEDIKAYVNLEDVGPGQHLLTPSAEVPNGVSVISFSPQQINVTLEEVESPQEPVVLEIVGAPADGIVMGEPRILPNSVFVRGPRSVLDRLDRVRAVVNIDEADSDRVQMVPVQAIDNSGAIMNDVAITPSMVEILLPFSEPQKTVPIRVPLTGEPAPGYKISQVNLIPAMVTLQGAEEDLAKITEILTDPVDVTGATATITLQLPLKAPDEAVKLLLDEPVNVEIQLVQE